MNEKSADSDRPLLSPSVASNTWAVRRAEKTDLQALLALFLRSFESPLTVARWDWKYAHAPCWGTVVERDGGLVGFFGGMPRQFTLHGKLVTGVQIGDCMVDPGQRGVLTRKGPMFLSAATYFEQMADIHPGAEFAFGYPSFRAMGVGRRLGLYSNIDKISLMSWSALTPQRSVLTRTRRMNDWPQNRQQQAVTQLWSAMRASLPDVLLPVRDWSWFKHRYLDHPEYTYELLIVSSRLTGQPKSLTVLRTHADHLELLDYLGSVDGVASALRAARMQAANAGLPLLQGWFTQRLTQIFNIGEPIVQDAGIEVPTNIWGKAQVADVLASPIWLMAGDSDFR
jgi:Acetyltransferase (GNAT) domain